jgi:hypothetical protein
MTHTLTQDELVKVNSLNSRYATMYSELGQVEIKIKEYQEALKNLEAEKAAYYQDYQKIVEDEVPFVKQLNEKYGQGSIDLSAGTITTA